MGTAKPNNSGTPRQALTDWLAHYHSSVGAAGDVCAPVLEGVLSGALKRKEGQLELLELLRVLQDLAPDPSTVCCAMLFVAERHGEALDNWTDIPVEVQARLDDLLRLKQVQSENLEADSSSSAEGLRRLLLALVKDVRVVLIALAWQLARLRLAKTASEQARALAHEAFIIHAPLANRLGVWQLKWEIEDLAFRFDDPEAYRRVASLVSERRTDRERFIEEFIDRLQETLAEAGIDGEVLGRPKHIFSIWKKMQRKGLGFHELFDVRAVRVLVDDVPARASRRSA